MLENRASEWQGEQSGAVLDTQDLKVVEAGALGMGAWTAPETRLVEASRATKSCGRLPRINGNGCSVRFGYPWPALAVLASLAAVMATIEKRQAVEATKTARTEAENVRNARDLAQTAEHEARYRQKNEAEGQKNEAEYQAKLARASSLERRPISESIGSLTWLFC